MLVYKHILFIYTADWTIGIKFLLLVIKCPVKYEKQLYTFNCLTAQIFEN